MKTLQDIRKEIDGIDEALMELFAKRFACSKEIANIKKETGMPVYDKAREEELFTRVEKVAKKIGVPKHIAKELFTEIVHQSRRAQEMKNR